VFALLTPALDELSGGGLRIRGRLICGWRRRLFIAIFCGHATLRALSFAENGLRNERAL
jgi:hypothetical protein